MRLLTDEEVAAALRDPDAILRELDRLDCEESLLAFVRRFWRYLEPSRPFVEGWHIDAICDHLEAVTSGEIKRLLINVPPGFMKSMLVNVFWPAWEWGPIDLASYRYVCASYSQDLTVRDNIRCRNLVLSDDYQSMWGERVGVSPDQFTKIKFANAATGWKLATSVGGVGTGERGDRFIIDDPHNVKEAESDTVRDSTLMWFREVVPTRLNDPENSAIVCIMQRVHDSDVSGAIIAGEMGWDHLMIPMEYDPKRECRTSIGWRDPRSSDGDLAWPQRFPRTVVDQLKRDMGPYAVAGQFQQSPTARGGGIIKRDWWKVWPPEDWLGDATVGGQATFPPMEFVLCQVDTAMSTKEENDWSACTTWGVWRDRTGVPRAMLMGAWQARLEFHPLVEKVIATARRLKADMVRIEAKANGISVAQEIVRLCRAEEFAVHQSQVKGDKVARAYAVQHMWSAGVVYAPDKAWADMVIDQMAAFPKGAHDDLVDTATAAVKYLRDSGMLQLVEEHQDEMRRRTTPTGPEQPPYDV